MDKFYTTQEVANRLKIKKTTVYELIKRGELHASKIGKQLRISQQQLDEYLGDSKNNVPPSSQEPTGPNILSDIPSHTADSAIRQMDYLLHTNGLIISSQESTLVELLRSQTENIPGSLPVLHSYMNDYNSLYSLYYEKTHLALVSHCAPKNGSGSTSVENPLAFLQNLLPGTSVAKIHLCDYEIGFYTEKGNPKKIRTLQDLTRPDVSLINREKGCCCRMFLDTLMCSSSIPVSHINGYKNEVLSHMALANAVLSGKGDTGIGAKVQLAAYPQLDFISLAKASMFLVFRASYLDHPAFQAIVKATSSDSFRFVLEHFDGYHIPEDGIRVTI